MFMLETNGSEDDHIHGWAAGSARTTFMAVAYEMAKLCNEEERDTDDDPLPGSEDFEERKNTCRCQMVTNNSS